MKEKNKENEIMSGEAIAEKRSFAPLRFILGDRKNVSARELVISLLRGILFSLISYFFARTSLLLDTYPLAIAFLSAAREKIVWIFLGALVSSLTFSPSGGVIFSGAVYAGAFALIILIRIIARLFIDPPSELGGKGFIEKVKTVFKSHLLFGENIYLRMATACACAFFVGLYAIREGEYRFYDLFSAMFFMVSAPAATYIFSNLWAKERDKLGVLLRGSALIALLAALSLSLKDTEVFGINLSVFLAFFSSIYLSRKKGILTGSAAGLFSGIAFSGLYAPAFVLSAITAGISSSYGAALITASACVSMLWGAYIDGFSSFSLLMPPLLCASVIYLGVEKLEKLPFFAEEKVSISSVATEAPRVESYEERMERLSKLFSELSASLYDISDRMKSPGACELGSICLRSFEKSCANCSENEKCHLGEYGEFSHMVTKSAEILGRESRLRKKDLPSYIAEKCVKLDEVIIEINASFAELMRDRISGEKTELLALDYEGVSHIIAESREKIKLEGEIDRDLTEAFCRNEVISSLEMREICISGREHKRLYIGDIGKKAEKLGVNELKRMLEDAMEAPLTEPIFELHGNKIALFAEKEKIYRTEWGVFSSAATGEGVNGDSSSAFLGKENRFYALISDGMGSGQSAAYTSEICDIFLQKMLLLGNRRETALKMLNNLLRARGEECSATIDLLEIDLEGGSASLLKSGASPTFVRRGDKLYKLRSSTAPIGILPSLEAEDINFEIEEGDVIIMMSDGVSQSPEECLWLMEMMGGEWDKNETPEDMAEKICKKAKENGSCDDITALLIKIEKAA
ncbi:MAG: SpoIIE family protein phosphatase [Clostridia bacterium]|nr:SpoIIE family protein phosphatase [Clostridia bacterium]